MSAKRILKNISWLVFDKIFMLLLGLIVVVKVASHYGPSEYGFYQYALSINILLGVIVLFVDGRVVKKHYQDKNEGYIIYNTTIAKLALSIVSLIIGILILLVIDRGIKFNTIYLLLLMNNIAINLAFGIQNYFEYRLKSKNVVIASNIANIISAALQLIAIFFDFSIISIVTIILISSFIKLLILFYQFKKSFSIKILTTVNKSLISGIIRESTPLAIAAIAAITYNRIDQVMIGAMLGVDEVGIYSISSQMVTVVTIAISPIQISVYPKMIEWYNSNIDIYYKKYQAITSLTTWIYIVGTAFAFIVAPVLLDKFLGVAYSKSLDVFKVQVFGALFMYNAALRSSHFTLTGNTNIMMVSQIIAVFVNIVLNYLMIPKIGIYGAAAATVVTQFFSLFLSNLFFKNGRKIFWLQLKGLNPMYIVQGLGLKESHRP
jgi:O-antigen/teichoic acid export membrane protein